jgi:hypothetical protein
LVGWRLGGAKLAYAGASDHLAATRTKSSRGAGSGQHLASVLQEGRENANIDAGLGFIWRISVHGSEDGRTATQLEGKVRDAVATLEKLSDADWKKLTATEKWPVGGDRWRAA